MAVHVRELRLEDVDAAVALARGASASTGEPRVAHQRSLTAHNGDDLLGVALCEVSGHQRTTTLRIAVRDGADAAVTRLLLDKALLKARAHGASRVRVVMADDATTLEDAAWP